MEDLYRVAIDTATLFSETDIAGTIVHVNDLFCTASGYSRHEIIGQNHRLINSQHHPASFYHEIWISITKGLVLRGQICNKSKDDARYWVYCTIIPILATETSHYRGDRPLSKGACKEPLRILRYISVSFDVTVQIGDMETLQRQALYDSLTGLPNRAFILEHLQKRISSAGDLHQKRFAVGMLDMNRFKLVNDTYGHSIGDRLLIETAKRLKASFRKEDVVARLGGDEFIIVWNDASIIPGCASVLKSTDCDEAKADPLYTILSRVFAQPYSLGDGVLLDNVSVSLGIALYPDHGLDRKTLLRHADQAMYQAKRREVCVGVFHWDLEGMGKR
ncbi:unnamed protein product [Penicillium glandicola]